MDSILQRFKGKFLDEANQILDKLETELLELERKPEDKELIESAFRAMHTLKGVSSMYGFEHVSVLTHHFESIYQAIRDKTINFTKEVFDITFPTIDHLRQLLYDEKLDDETNKENHKRLLGSVMSFLNHKNETHSENENELTNSNESEDSGVFTDATWQIILRTNEKQFFRGVNLTSIFSDLSALGKFRIIHLENLSTAEVETWNVLLYTSATENEIRETIMFIEDDCIVSKLSNDNLFTTDNEIRPIQQQEKTMSILDFIESMNMETENNKIESSAPTHKHKLIETLTHDRNTSKRIMVDASQLDSLMFLVSELITVNSQLMISTKKPIYLDIRDQIEKVDSLSKQFRNNALEIRLVPISDLVLKFQRLVRDLSKQLGKKVEFESHGTDTKLDKNIIDQLAEPLMHLIRNCLDHGIETPAERLKKGKPEVGILTLSAYNVGNFVNISISDDGNGINTEKVRQKAIEKGIIAANQKLTDKKIFDFIFLPGFSTAHNLSDVSGRGVGMDVVKQRITELRGEVFIESENGKGTSFILKLQQSLSIIDTLLFRVDKAFFIIPLSNIEVCDEISEQQISEHSHTSTIPYNDELIYFVDLRKIFQLPNAYTSKTKTIIVNNGDTRIALLVDKIEGEHQAVLKPLGDSFKNQKYITSVSQLGDGNNAFMIDTGAIIRDTKTKTNVELDV